MSEVCFVCGRKANRQCLASPVLGHDPESTDSLGHVIRRICSQCCGKGRRRTIDCPDSCPHFGAGARTALLKLVELSRDPDFELQHGDVLHNLRLVLTRVRRSLMVDMTDAEARQALANVADTMRTRSSGLIYDFRSPAPRVQMVYDALVTVARLHERGEKGMEQADAAILMRCLKYLERQAATAEKQERGATFYLDLIAQTVSREFLTREPEGFAQG